MKFVKKIIKKMVPNSLKIKIRKKMIEKVREELKNTECIYNIRVDEINRFKDKVAVVTGGSGAIGSAICFKLAMEGATVIVCGRNINNSKKIVDFIKEHNGKAEALILDITNYENIKEQFEKIYEKYGSIDILINNAGGSARENASKIETQKVEIIDDLLDTNLRGTMLCSKEVIKYMKKNKWGRIVNIASTCGVRGLAGFSEYSTSKAGVIMFTQSLAMEVAKEGITVNCVSPGVTEHIIWDKCIEPANTKKTYTEKLGKTDDIANAVEFFCKEESNFIIGQNLIVDGGRSLGLKGE